MTLQDTALGFSSSFEYDQWLARQGDTSGVPRMGVWIGAAVESWVRHVVNRSDHAEAIDIGLAIDDARSALGLPPSATPPGSAAHSVLLPLMQAPPHLTNWLIRERAREAVESQLIGMRAPASLPKKLAGMARRVLGKGGAS